MILTPFLLLSAGVRISVLGEGRLRFAAGRTVAFAPMATLTTNAAGLLADASGRPVLPQIHLSGPVFTVSMNGTVSVAGRAVDRLVLQRTDGEIGFPGEGTFGVLRIEGARPGIGRGVPASGAIDRRKAATIRIRPRTEVDGDRVMLRDVAELAGDRDTVAHLREIDLGDTPVLGSRRSLTRWSLGSVLRNAGFAEGSVVLELPLDATVARKGQTVEPKSIMDAASDEAKKAFGDVELVQKGAGSSPVLAPTGELSLETQSRRDGTKIAVTVRVRVDGRIVGERAVAFEATLDGVKSGDAVHVVVERNGAVLETEAKAKTSGFVGETIQILTTDGATLTATVTGKGSVEVKL